MPEIATDSGSIEYTCWVSPSCVAGTAAASYTTTPVPIHTVMLWRVEFRIPPGHQGTTGIAVVDSGAFIVPFSSPLPAWLVGDDDLLEYPYNKELGSNVVLATYNTGTFNHAWQVRLIYTPMTAVETGGAGIEVPAPADWLAS